MKKVFKSKAFSILLIVALLFCMAPQFALTAYAEGETSFEVSSSNENCQTIGEYLGGDVYYLVAPEGTNEVVFKDAEELAEYLIITGLLSGMLEETNVAPISGDFRATWETLNSNDSIDFDDGAEDLDYSNAYFYFVSDFDEYTASFIIQVPEAQEEILDFEASVGVKTGPVENGYTYTAYVYAPDDPNADQYGYVMQEASADMYTLAVPIGTEEVTFNFGTKATISYNYDEYGMYLDGYYADATVGETTTTKKVDSNNDGIPDYIWVQNPYNADWSGGELLYVIKMVYSYTFKVTVNGTEMTEMEYTPNNYSYFDYMTGQTQTVGTYTVTLPYGTQAVDLDFSDNVICYNYTKDGTYLGGYYSDYMTGSTEAHGVPVDYGDSMTPADGEFDYIQVQTPYDEAYNSTLLYTITFDYAAPFTTDIGETTGFEKNGYAYTAYVSDPENPDADQYGYVMVPSKADMFTVTIPALDGAKNITIDFLGAKTISYNYDGNGNYLDGYYPDATVGESETTKPIDSNSDGVPDYIWVQNPYNADFSGGELLYVIKLVYDVNGGAEILDVYEMLVAKAAKLMSDDNNAAFGVGDWFIFDQARDGREVNPHYLETVKAYIEEHEGDLVGEGNAYTTYSRTILAMTALGADPRTYTDYNLLEGIADLEKVTAQGLNGAIWALIALDSHDYTPPVMEDIEEENLATRDALYEYIADKFLEDGGWAFTGTEPDVDITAMALTALAPYTWIDDISDKVDQAVAWLSEVQNEDGTFSAMYNGIKEPTAESTAWVVMALSTLGIDPATDARFIKNGNSAMNGLCSFAVLEGDNPGMKHTADGPVNILATDQGYRAFVAYMRLINEKFDVYDLLDQMLLTRVYGKTRYSTSLEVAERYMKNNFISELDSVVIATGDDFPDALSGSSLSINNEAPVLLISNKVQSSRDDATAFIEENLVEGGDIYIVGGKGAVSEEYAASLEAMGYTVSRYSGKSRYNTNLAILQALPESDVLLVCSGANYADAATASATGLPVLLAGAKLEDYQLEYLESAGKKDIYIIGGKGAVSEEIEAVLADYDKDGAPERVAGKDRALTAKAVAEEFFDLKPYTSTVVFAYGGNFPDCISGGLLAHSLDAPILYGGAHSSYTDADTPYMQEHIVKNAYILGGPSLISDEFVFDMDK